MITLARAAYGGNIDIVTFLLNGVLANADLGISHLNKHQIFFY